MSWLRDAWEARRITAIVERSKAFSGEEILPQLAAFTSASLARVAASSEAWHVRWAAIQALRGRVDASIADPLLSNVRSANVSELERAAVIELLLDAPPPGLLETLRAIRVSVDTRHSFELFDVVHTGLARLGDLEAALPTLTVLASGRYLAARRAGEAMRALEAAKGRDAIAQTFGAPDASPDALRRLTHTHDSPHVRRWALEASPAGTSLALAALADADPLVADGALAKISAEASPTDVEALVARARGTGVAVQARARAILALHRLDRTEEARAALLELPRVPLPGVPERVRRAILYVYREGYRETDPRHLLEAELEHGFAPWVESDEGPDETFDAVVAAAREALRTVGVALGPVADIALVRGQGSGTYGVAQVEGRQLHLSTLGRFVAYDSAPSAKVREALEAAGFLFVDGELARTVFDGLYVSDFGTKATLSVHALLFHWVD